MVPRRLPRLLLPALLGCAMPADVSPGPDPQLTVELSSRPVQSPDDEDWARATGGQGRIAVEGSITTPTPCYTLAGRARRDGRTVTLTVAAERKEGGCIQMIAGFRYDAAVRGLPAGTYTLRVQHAYAGTGWETRTAAETQVEVR
jgi:hypothetical protein